MGSRINQSDDHVPDDAAIPGGDVVEGQAHGHSAASARSKGPAEELFGLVYVSLELALNVGDDIFTIEEGPEQKVSDVIALDIIRMRAQGPKAQVPFGIGDILQAALEESLPVDIVRRVAGSKRQPPLKGSEDEKVIECLGRNERPEGRGQKRDDAR